MNILNKYTVKTLVKNKTRTLVTIIGIILSAAMITAVTTFISSLQNFMLETIIAEEGSWHGAGYDFSLEKATELENKKEVAEAVSLQNLGYASLAESQNEYKPYLFVAGVSENFTDMMPLRLTEGRMPQSETEIILPDHLASNGGIKYNMGDVLKLELGDRVWEGTILNQHYAYHPATEADPQYPEQQATEAEQLVLHTTKTYTVVGFYQRPGFEAHSAPGYTALTVASQAAEDATYDLYLKVDKPNTIYQFMTNNTAEGDMTECHTGLLRYMGASNEDSFNAVLYSLAGILIAIIMFASISLIYNAFSISVSERTKQFGLISSIGATKRQLLHTVVFEALVLSAIGIPLGILSGIGGIGVTLKLTSSLFTSTFLGGTGNTSLHLSVSAASVLTAATVGLVTVLVSAFIPARRAVKVSAIDAIRQNSDITFNEKKVRTSKLTYKLFGFSGMVASKNFKRNKKKYRTTVISLFMSVVLFISASSFCAYMEKGASSLITDPAYDISYAYTPDQRDKIPMETLLSLMGEVEGVSRSGCLSVHYETLSVRADAVTEEYKTFCEKYGRDFSADEVGNAAIGAIVVFADNSTYDAYLRESGLDPNSYRDKGEPTALVFNQAKIYESGEGRYHTMKFLKENSFSAELTDYTDQGEKYVLHTVSADHFTDQILYGTESMYGDSPILVYPYDALPAVMAEKADQAVSYLYFTADNHQAVYEKMCGVLEDNQVPTTRLYDQAAARETDKAVLLLVRIFSTGFIVLISLIAAANVFNTISTNISLRRREFAMLRSIGMTNRGFNKMMNFECLLYGFKGLLLGLPVSFAVTFLIYQSILNGWNVSFFIPWSSVVIAVISVFLVVFATMLYSMGKIKKENTVDALKNENL